jgi:hypothetical protein
MDKGQNQKNAKNLRQPNILEGLKDIGASTAKSFKKDFLSEAPNDFFDQIMGRKPSSRKFSGEITPGESVELNEVFTGKRESEEKLRAQIALERKLAEEERRMIEKRSNELRLQLNALMQEILALAKTTQNIGDEIEIAVMQAPANPGVYHVVFFEKLLEFLKSFRKKIESAGLWLHASNSRAEKKNYWATYKKHGSKFLLSPDHYLQRSAG